MNFNEDLRREIEEEGMDIIGLSNADNISSLLEEEMENDFSHGGQRKKKKGN